MTGDLGVGATALKLYLYLRDGVLKGAAVTDPAPQLPHWVELKKDQRWTSRTLIPLAFGNAERFRDILFAGKCPN